MPLIIFIPLQSWRANDCCGFFLFFVFVFFFYMHVYIIYVKDANDIN